MTAITDESLTQLANVLRNRREELGLTQADIAEKAGMTQTLVSKWERRPPEMLPIGTLSALGDALRLSPGTLLRIAGVLSDESERLAPLDQVTDGMVNALEDFLALPNDDQAVIGRTFSQMVRAAQFDSRAAARIKLRT